MRPLRAPTRRTVPPPVLVVIAVIVASVVCFRTKHTVTLVSQFPFKHIQIILRLYKSPAETLLGFDVDSCAVAFNGTDVLMTPRAHFALVSQYNTVRCHTPTTTSVGVPFILHIDTA